MVGRTEVKAAWMSFPQCRHGAKGDIDACLCMYACMNISDRGWQLEQACLKGPSGPQHRPISTVTPSPPFTDANAHHHTSTPLYSHAEQSLCKLPFTHTRCLKAFHCLLRLLCIYTRPLTLLFTDLKAKWMRALLVKDTLENHNCTITSVVAPRRNKLFEEAQTEQSALWERGAHLVLRVRFL